MEITSVKLRRIVEDERMKAVVSLTIDDELAVHDIKVIDTGEKIFVAMPSRRSGDIYRDIVHPINVQAREKIERAVIDAYESSKIEHPAPDEM